MYLLFIWNWNLTEQPVFVIANSDNPGGGGKQETSGYRHSCETEIQLSV